MPALPRVMKSLRVGMLVVGTHGWFTPDPPGRGIMAARFAAATCLSINPIYSRNRDDPLADRSGHR